MLESYMMGELSDEEMMEVDRLAKKHPAIKEELEKIRKGIIVYAEAAGKQPSNEILKTVFSALPDSRKDIHAKSPDQDTAGPKIKRFRIWPVAATFLLLVSATLNLLFFVRLKDSREQIESLKFERSSLADQVGTAQLKLNHAASRIAQFMNEDNIQVRMDGLAISPTSFAHVFWNKKTNAIFISVDNLPEPPHGHQYQLWAIKSGQSPIDAGIFDHNNQIQKLKVIRGNVSAFAVTLEKEGGTQNATVEKTYVKGFL